MIDADARKRSVKKESCTSADAVMYVAERGPSDGVPIVFLHGSMVAGWMWTGQVEDLAEFRCLVPDFPGFDRSAERPWVSFASTADDVAGVISSRCGGGGAHLVGLSLGGIVALNVAVRHPSAVRSLIVSGVPYGRVSRSLRGLGTALLWLYGRPWGARLVGRFFGLRDDESLRAFLQTASRTDPRALRAVMREVSEAPLPTGLERLQMPLLAVVGENDTAPAQLAVPHLVNTVSGAEGRMVRGVGHQWNAEDRALFSDVVRLWVTVGLIDDRLRSVA